jgi:hypothetical protein
MEAQTKEYVRALLNLVKELYAKFYGLQTLIHISSDQNLRINWESDLAQLLLEPEPKKELDAKFDPQIEQILRILEDQEGVAALLRTPTKGLPS